MEQNCRACIATSGSADIAVSFEAEGQSPEERALRYFAKAEQARIMASQTTDPLMQEAFRKLVAEWEYLANYALRKRI